VADEACLGHYCLDLLRLRLAWASWIVAQASGP
jgi:hypothetical protein